MKLNASFAHTLAVSLALFTAMLLGGRADAQDLQQGKAEVRVVQGSAQYSRAGGAYRPLVTGTTLRAGDVVRTDAASFVTLFLGKNGGYVRVTPNSTLAIDKLTFTETGADAVVDTQLDLRAGAIVGKVDKLAAASKYEIKTPRGVAGIRGTIYRVSADGEVTVAEGTVIVVYVINGVPQPPITVQAGQTVRPGGTPQPAPPDLIRELLDISWIEAEGPVTPVTVYVAPVIEPFVSPTTGASVDDFDGFR